MDQKSIQENYPDDLNYCYGCGRFNEHGLQIKSYWDGDETVAAFQPEPYHIAIPGYVYGGLLASLIDCHGIGTAAAAVQRANGPEPGAGPTQRFVTASLHVEYLRPTPLGPPLEIRGKVTEIKGRKVTVEAWISAAGEVCVRGQVVAVQIPEYMMGEN